VVTGINQQRQQKWDDALEKKSSAQPIRGRRELSTSVSFKETRRPTSWTNHGGPAKGSFDHCLEFGVSECAFLLQVSPDLVQIVVADALAEPCVIGLRADMRIHVQSQIDRVGRHQIVWPLIQVGMDA